MLVGCGVGERIQNCAEYMQNLGEFHFCLFVCLFITVFIYVQQYILTFVAYSYVVSASQF